MYFEYFKIKKEPFSATPDPRFLYRSPRHQEALERLNAAVSMRRGVTALVGEPGLGKSTLIRTMLSDLKEQVHFAWLFNTTLNSTELLRYICRDFGLEPRGDDKGQVLMELYTFLIDKYKNGINCVLIIDEAQNLSRGSGRNPIVIQSGNCS
ncbi:MAG: AAA family ATPase [candidate division KSB1 bacterium]|nr:AAA family ATPase [candidate division KSB1 bacterium]